MTRIAGRHSGAPTPDTTNWTREQLAWAGGLFEGEGCFRVDRSANYMTVTSTDLDVLERFRSIVGCGNIKPFRISPGAGSRKQPYRWTVGGRLNVYALGVALWPWLGSRRRARFTDCVRAMPGPRTHCGNGHEWTEDNTYVWTRPSGLTQRGCRACRRDAGRRHLRGRR